MPQKPRAHSLQIAGAFSPAPRPGRPRVYVYVCRVGGPPPLAPPGWGLLGRTSWTEAKMADLQTDGARVLSLWRNEGVSSYRKRPRDPGQLAKLMINIDSGEDREVPTSAKPLRPIRPKPSAASE